MACRPLAWRARGAQLYRQSSEIAVWGCSRPSRCRVLARDGAWCLRSINREMIRTTQSNWLDISPLTFLPRNWQETLCHIIFSLIFCTPIEALAQRYSAWFGALTFIVGDLLMFYYWLQIPPPRPEFGMDYFVTSALFASAWALSSHLWWMHAFKHRIARTD